MDRQAAIKFLLEAANYFERRPTDSDMSHWSNVYNAENCRKIAAMLDPALCQDEGCPQYGTDHVCISSTPPK